MFFEKYKPIPKSKIRENQKKFFEKNGINAWKKGHIPFDFTNNSYYTYKLVQNIIDIINNSQLNTQKNINILEVGAGSGLFAINFLYRIEQLDPQIFNKINYTITDYSQTILDNIQKNNHIQYFMKKGVLQTKPFDISKDTPPLDIDIFLMNYVVCNIPFQCIKKQNNIYYEKTILPKSPILKENYQKIDKPSYSHIIDKFLDNKTTNETVINTTFLDFLAKVFDTEKEKFVYVADSGSSHHFELLNYGENFFNKVNFELIEIWLKQQKINFTRKQFENPKFSKSIITNSNYTKDFFYDHKDDFLYKNLKSTYNLIFENKLEKAQKNLEKVIKYRDKDANIYFHYSKILKKLGKNYSRAWDLCKKYDYLDLYTK
ncbi:SAM-dependent methyltransferase [Candidatus Absconditicoccus praedator]|uniref:SAM-dependent methyltransferase n=1 Tax=Candidatus Absconditicoccus praedator TaxID=2735562 RepID=UPI001E38133B|nr:SAM-dependent methyltransferase [Candidatus Absconditicoccus praedator]UFX83153.1 SAM-dependent methyltransferase [Candidatus Absconditicoccus praedator]